MLALSIQQPWAWLIVNGYKDIENRDWFTKVRGPVLIHAGKKFDAFGYEWVSDNFPDIPMPDPREFEMGGIVGGGNILDCVKAHPSKWFQGKFGFVFGKRKPLPFRPLRGQLGFFEVPEAA